jgi:DNA-binding MurR/RpiR family transcriptional regulator
LSAVDAAPPAAEVPDVSSGAGWAQPLPADHPLAKRLLGYGDLTTSQRRLADLLIEMPHEVAFMSASELGSRARVSDSTVVRFSTALGYSGYPELRQELERTLMARAAPVRLFEERLTAAAGPAETLTVDRENLERLYETLTAETTDAAVRALSGADRVFVLGRRGGFGVAHLCFHLLQPVLDHVELLGSVGGSLPDQLQTLTDNGALIAFSTPRYSREILRIVQYAVRIGASVVAVTDSPLAPIGRIATVVLPVPVRSTSFFPSMVAAHALVNVLVSELAKTQHDAVQDKLTRREVIVDEFKILMSGNAETSPKDR